MNENVCPKCGAEPVPDEGQNPPPIGYVCGSMPRIFAGGFHQDDKCRIRELEAENARLREIIVAAAIPLETLYGQIMIKPYKELSAELQARISTVVPVIRAALQPAKEPK